MAACFEYAHSRTFTPSCGEQAIPAATHPDGGVVRPSRSRRGFLGLGEMERVEESGGWAVDNGRAGTRAESGFCSRGVARDVYTKIRYLW
jgi:hypothetical protein